MNRIIDNIFGITSDPMLPVQNVQYRPEISRQLLERSQRRSRATEYLNAARCDQPMESWEYEPAPHKASRFANSLVLLGTILCFFLAYPNQAFLIEESFGFDFGRDCQGFIGDSQDPPRSATDDRNPTARWGEYEFKSAVVFYLNL